MFKDGMRILQPSTDPGGSRGICWFPTGSGEGNTPGLMICFGCAKRLTAAVRGAGWDLKRTGQSRAVAETAISTRPVRAAGTLQWRMGLGTPVGYRCEEKGGR